jgi:hypothetical protein
MKKTLLIAAAALAAGVISTQAQPVYSQNFVGYVNQPLAAGNYSLITVPLQASSTNAPEQVLPALQAGDAILLWSGVTYQTYTFFGPGQWLYPDNSTIGAGPNLPAGTTIFYLNTQPSSETNTVTGNVVLSNTNAPITLAAGGYSLIGSLPPLGVSSLEDTNLNLPLQAGDAVLLWNGSAYQTYTFFGPGQWLYPDNSTIGVSPGVAAGNGFFYLNTQPSDEVWSQNLIVQ